MADTPPALPTLVRDLVDQIWDMRAELWSGEGYDTLDTIATDIYTAGVNTGRADEANRISAAFSRHKIEWLIRLLDLIDNLAKSRGLDTGTEAQDDLRKLADLLEG